MELATNTTRVINISTVFLCIILLFVFFPKKTLNYDEPFQIMCSHGIGNSVIHKFDSSTLITAQELSKENTFKNVFLEGGDSIHYVLLHYFTAIAGNGLQSYVLFSVLWTIGTIIAFYFMCRVLFKDSLVVSIAIICLFFNMIFDSQIYVIRHYMSGVFFITMAGIYFFKYIFDRNSIGNFIMLLVFCFLSFISHYFTVFIIAGFGLVILARERLKFFNRNNIVAFLVAFGLLLLYYSVHSNPLVGMQVQRNYATKFVMNQQNQSIFSISSLFMRYFSISFGMLFTVLKDVFWVRFLSFFVVIASFFYAGIRLIKDKPALSRVSILFVVAVCNPLFILLLVLLSRVTLLFTYRYFIFGVPFCMAYVAFIMKYIFDSKKLKYSVQYIVVVLFLAPSLIEFVLLHSRPVVGPACNHYQVINDIVKNDVHRIDVPGTVDAVFINCMLPENYDIKYYIKPGTSDAVLYRGASEKLEEIPLIKNDLIVLF